MRTRDWLAVLLGPVLLLIGWQLLATGLEGKALLAGPVEVLHWLTQNIGLVARALGRTLGNAALGYLAGNLIAIVLTGIGILFPKLLGVIGGLALVLFCLPLIATGPILRSLMGQGEGPQITLAALAVSYTSLVTLLTGLRAVPSAWLDLVHVYGRKRFAELWFVRARAALPYLFAGLQIAAPAAFLGAMVGEFTGAERGLGVLTIRYIRALDVAALWGISVVATVVSIMAYAAVGMMARLVLHDLPPVVLLSSPASGRCGKGRFRDAVVLVVAVLLLWWGGIRLLGLNPFLAKGPLDVAAALTWSAEASESRAALFLAFRQSLGFALPGYLIGLGVGAGLAMLLVLVPAVVPLIMPIAVALRAVPIVTTAPVFVLFLGRGATGTITLVAVMVFFPALVACIHGLRQAPGQVLDVFDVYAAGPFRKLLYARIPAMLPALFAAARMSVPTAVLAVTVVEWLTTGRGLGSLMALSASTSNYRMLWSAVFLVTLFSVLSHAAVASLERHVLRIYAPEQVRQ
ncbi:ABC transporter permease [Paracoccus aestuariivivens]|uniref:ABC transporter permease subunit n=1 Tax=Paracoccus aestuariivivens TaxID=1820333 RepID=A0A6L6J6K2_9RHOB|nr:ABC transporter permease subunit [Paracoccus aestuariivivens]MTH76838.1 ABC transporter permease subunit [Paracoccus aestuariivivens]